MTRRILVCRLDKVGDAVLSTPFLHNLRRGFPDASIVALMSPYNEAAWAANPNIDERYTPADAAHVPKLGVFDIAVALSPTSASYKMVAASRAAQRWGIVYSRRLGARISTLFQLTRPTIVDVDGALKRGAPVMHEVLQTLSILQTAGVAVDEVPLQVFPSASQLASASTMVLQGPCLGVHLSVRWFTDGWTMASFVTLTQRLLEEFPQHRLLITYGAIEAEMARQLPPWERVQVVGNLDFGTWAAVIGQCQLFLSTDTGALHVAAAMQVPVVGVYEHASFAHCSQQWAPWMVQHDVVAKASVEATADAACRALGKLLSRLRRR